MKYKKRKGEKENKGNINWTGKTMKVVENVIKITINKKTTNLNVCMRSQFANSFLLFVMNGNHVKIIGYNYLE